MAMMPTEFEEPAVGRESDSANFSAARPLRLAYFVSHPIQYQAPLLRTNCAGKGHRSQSIFQLKSFSPRVHRSRLRGFGEVGRSSAGGIQARIPAGAQGRRGAWAREAAELWNWPHPPQGRVRRDMGSRLQHPDQPAGIRAAHAIENPCAAAGGIQSDRSPAFSARRWWPSVSSSRGCANRISAALSIGEANTAYWRHYLGRGFSRLPVLLRGGQRVLSAGMRTRIGEPRRVSSIRWASIRAGR